MSTNERRAMVGAWLTSHVVTHCPARTAAGSLKWRIHGHYFA
jgi:hypothetical protein